MAAASGNSFDLYDDPFRYYNIMLEDIRNATQNIYLETYRFMNDSIGLKFRNELIKRAKKGVEVVLLLDSWGTSLPRQFFDELESHGGKIKYFSRIKLAFDLFTKNHKRNHRKLLIIDESITYIGSANISDYSLNWREMMLRVEGRLSNLFVQSFLESVKLHKRSLKSYTDFPKILKFHNYELVQDIPSIIRQQIKTRFEQLIAEAKSSIFIETPYFLPGHRLRKVLREAGERGVEVKVIVPKQSDVRLVDVLRGRYLGIMHESNVDVFFYLPGNLHAKCMLIDDKKFAIGSANFDYRSFRYMHEIVLCGHNQSLTKQLKEHFNESLLDSEKFDYQKWKQRPLIQKLFERLILPFRHLL